MTEKREFYRRSANGEGHIMSFEWKVDKPKAIVQIVHDMSEHSGRYQDFIKILNDNGINVYANDLTGHGYSKQGHRGSFALKPGAINYLLADIDSLFSYATKENEEIPRIIIGFGFGSMLSELYTIRYKGADMLVAVGSLAVPKGATAIKMAADVHMRRFGYNAVSESVHNMMYQHNSRLNGNLNKQFFWLSTDEEEVQKYIDDENCGFPLTSSGYREVLQAFKILRGRHGIVSIPNIPIFLLSGAEDQFGECGESVKKIVSRLTMSGHDQVAFKLYSACYHDVLHDQCRKHVCDDIITWIELNLRN